MHVARSTQRARWRPRGNIWSGPGSSACSPAILRKPAVEVTINTYEVQVNARRKLLVAVGAACAGMCIVFTIDPLGLEACHEETKHDQGKCDVPQSARRSV